MATHHEAETVPVAYPGIAGPDAGKVDTLTSMFKAAEAQKKSYLEVNNVKFVDPFNAISKGLAQQEEVDPWLIDYDQHKKLLCATRAGPLDEKVCAWMYTETMSAFVEGKVSSEELKDLEISTTTAFSLSDDSVQQPRLSIKPEMAELPAIVHVCGLDESYSRLVMHKNNWFLKSAGHVQVVVLVKLYSDEEKKTLAARLEVYRIGDMPPPHGNALTEQFDLFGPSRNSNDSFTISRLEYYDAVPFSGKLDPEQNFVYGIDRLAEIVRTEATKAGYTDFVSADCFER